MSKRHLKLLTMHIGIFALIAGYYLLTHFLETGCIIKYIIKYPCPTCGMSRAILSVFRWDWGSYFAYNVMAIPMFGSLFLAFHFKKKWTTALLVIVAGANIVYFIVRLTQGTIL